MIEATGLLGQEKAFSLLEDALRGSPADQTELVLVVDTTSVTRYANSEIHQNVSQFNTRVSVRVAVGKATARVFTNSLDITELRRAIEEAARLAKMQAPNPRFRSLPTPDMGYERPESAPQSYFEATANLTPQARAEAVGRIIDTASSDGYKAFGTYKVSASE